MGCRSARNVPSGVILVIDTFLGHTCIMFCERAVSRTPARRVSRLHVDRASKRHHGTLPGEEIDDL